jgi:hypothetical protein
VRLVCAGALALLACDREAPAPDPAEASSPPAAVGPPPGPQRESEPVVAPSKIAAVADPPPSRASAVVAAIAPDGLRRDVTALAADALRGRATPSPGLDAAAKIVADRFDELGLRSPTPLSDHRQTFACGGPLHPGDAANVVGVVDGRDPEAGLVLVSAHYDHIGEQPGQDDPVFNGANDDASGVAAMLAIAGAVAALDPPPSRGVVFVAFCGEELGLRGSKHFADEPVIDLSKIVAGLNLEMLGRSDPDHPRRGWVTGMELSTLGGTLRTANHGTDVTFVPSRDVGPAEAGTFERSDNYPLARRGIVAHSISTGRLDRYYHAADDEADSLDYEAMAALTRAIARAVVDLADGGAAPEWTEAGRTAGYAGEAG